MLRLLALCAALAMAAPPLSDDEPPDAALQATSSPRLALPVKVRFDDGYSFEPVGLTPQAGGKPASTSEQPHLSLSRFTLGIARRHFEDAKWADAKDSGKKGRVVMIKKVVLLVSPGPNYNAQV